MGEDGDAGLGADGEAVFLEEGVEPRAGEPRYAACVLYVTPCLRHEVLKITALRPPPIIGQRAQGGAFVHGNSHLLFHGGTGYFYAYLHGQMLGKEGRLMVGCGNGALYGIDQLSHVPRPLIDHQGVEKFRRKALRPDLIAFADPRHMEHCELFDVLSSCR